MCGWEWWFAKNAWHLGGTVSRPVSTIIVLFSVTLGDGGVFFFWGRGRGEGRITKYLFYTPALSFNLRVRERKRQRERECVCVCVIVSTSLCVHVLMECIYTCNIFSPSPHSFFFSCSNLTVRPSPPHLRHLSPGGERLSACANGWNPREWQNERGRKWRGSRQHSHSYHSLDMFQNKSLGLSGCWQDNISVTVNWPTGLSACDSDDVSVTSN